MGFDSHDEFPWHLGVFDAHCHPTETVDNLPSIPTMKAKALVIMASRIEDQELVARAADQYGVTASDLRDDGRSWSNSRKLIPSFGWHPWFSHQLFDEQDYNGATRLSPELKRAHYERVLNPHPNDQDFLEALPDPRPLGQFIDQTRSNLDKYPLALIGEVGLDKSFRIPDTWRPDEMELRDESITPGGREGRKLTPFRVNIEHQKKILLAQLRLAGKMGRAVSIHGVQAHGLLYNVISHTWKGYERNVLSNRERKKQNAEFIIDEEVPTQETDNVQIGPRPYPPRICLHSFAGQADLVKQYIAATVPCDVYFSFSTSVNKWVDSEEGKVEQAVMAVPDDRLLAESDVHTAGDTMDAYLEEAVRKLCRIKQWELHAGVRRLKHNWLRFTAGSV